MVATGSTRETIRRELRLAMQTPEFKRHMPVAPNDGLINLRQRVLGHA